MAGSPSAPFPLTPLDSIIEPRFVTNLVIFPNSNSDQTSVTRTLRASLAQTIQVIPYLAGSVDTFSTAEQKGRLAIQGPWRTVDDIFTVKDLTSVSHLDYKTLRDAHFPVECLNYNVLLSLPHPSKRPVILVQVNLIRGGIILGISVDHAVADETGVVTIAKVWAAYCRGEDGSLIIGPDVLDRSRLMTGNSKAKLRTYLEYAYTAPEQIDTEKVSTAVDDFAHKHQNLVARILSWARNMIFLLLRILSNLITYHRIRFPSPNEPYPEKPSPDAQLFFFSTTKLAELKQMASSSTTPDPNPIVPWITTHDALSSLLWCCIATVWQNDKTIGHSSPFNPIHRMLWQLFSHTTSPISILAVILNGRRLLHPPLHPNYIGNVVLACGIGAPLPALHSTPSCVAKHAHALRHRINQIDKSYLQGVVGAINSVPDIRGISTTRGPFPDTGLVVVSWAGHRWYELDWGEVVGGHCERVRMGKPDTKLFCQILPKLPEGKKEGGEGGLEVIIKIKSEDLRSLKENELFNRFAEWRCN